MRLSLQMVVHNEAARLEGALLHCRQFCDELVVAVQQSTDDTLTIARRLADIVIEHPHYGYASASRAAVNDAATGEWNICLDADETLTPFALERIRTLLERPYDFIRLRRLTTVDGVVLEDAPHGRLWRRGFAVIPSTVHTDYTPVPGARTHTEEAEVWIAHDKTADEQADDDARYRRLMGEAYDRTIRSRWLSS